MDKANVPLTHLIDSCLDHLEHHEHLHAEEVRLVYSYDVLDVDVE